MAIEWGAWEGSSPNRIRVGIDADDWTEGDGTGPVVHDSAQAQVFATIHTDVEGTWSDNQTITFSGAISGSVTFANNQSNGSPVQRASKLFEYDYLADEYGTSPGSRTFTASLSGAFNGATPSKSVTKPIPARPYGAPAPLTAVAASRNSDTSTTVSWTRHATTGEPYDKIFLQKSINGGAYSNISLAIAGSATSYNFASSANTKYRFQAAADNSVGTSAYALSSASNFFTTPAAPTGAPGHSTPGTATWGNVGVGYSEWQTELWVSRDNGASWALLTTQANTVTSYADPSFNSTQKTGYKIRRKTTAGTQGTLYSGFSPVSAFSAGASSAPDAPTELDPAGNKTVLRGAINRLSWQHNPTDGTAQTMFKIQWRVGAGAWNALATDTSSANQFYDAAANTFTAASTIGWQVATKGSNATYSAWSTEQFFVTTADPNSANIKKRIMQIDLDTGKTQTAPLGSDSPIGSVMMFAGGNQPPGWLFCNGALVSTTTYSSLFATIGHAYNNNVDPGGGQFKLPDLRDRFPMGGSGTKGIGSTGGTAANTVQLDDANIPVHTHDINHNHPSFTSASDNANHTHSFGYETISTTSTGGTSLRVMDIDQQTGGVGTQFTATTGNESVAHQHVIDVPALGVTASGVQSPAGGTTAVDIQNHYQALNYIIKI